MLTSGRAPLYVALFFLRSTEDGKMPTETSTALITNDIVGLGLIAATLAVIFWAASGPTPQLKKIFAWVPALLLCYFIPAIYNTVGLIDGHNTSLYNPVARDVLLPAALVLLTLSIDLKGILKLGPKLLVMFCAGTLGIILGAIVSFQAMSWIHPATVAGDTWKGMAALAGSWIGGGANMVAMREVFGTDATTFGQFAVVDVACASLWMAVLLFLANRAQQIDTRNGADTSAIDEMKARISAYEAQNARIPSLTDLMVIVGVALGGVGLAHAIAAPLSGWFKANVSWASQFSLDSAFVWVVLLSTALARHAVPVLPDCLHRHADGPVVAAGPPVAVRAGRDLDAHPHPGAVDCRQAAARAAVLLRDRLAGQHRRGRVGTGGGCRVSSLAGSGGRAAGHGGLRHRHRPGLCHRPDPEMDGRGLTRWCRPLAGFPHRTRSCRPLAVFLHRAR
jgi:uncharacterized membrane protein